MPSLIYPCSLTYSQSTKHLFLSELRRGRPSPPLPRPLGFSALLDKRRYIWRSQRQPHAPSSLHMYGKALKINALALSFSRKRFFVNFVFCSTFSSRVGTNVTNRTRAVGAHSWSRVFRCGLSGATSNDVRGLGLVAYFFRSSRENGTGEKNQYLDEFVHE